MLALVGRRTPITLVQPGVLADSTTCMPLALSIQCSPHAVHDMHIKKCGTQPAISHHAVPDVIFQ